MSITSLRVQKPTELIQVCEEERSYLPRGFLLADHKTGLIFDCYPYEGSEYDAQEAISRLTTHIMDYGLPSEIQVKSDLLVAMLTDLCRKVGIALRRVGNLPQVEYLLREQEEGF